MTLTAPPICREFFSISFIVSTALVIDSLAANTSVTIPWTILLPSLDWDAMVSTVVQIWPTIFRCWSAWLAMCCADEASCSEADASWALESSNSWNTLRR
jgi:hypothetical protein